MHHGIQRSPMMVYSNVFLHRNQQTAASFVDPEIYTDTTNDLRKSIAIAQQNISGATRARQLKCTQSVASILSYNIPRRCTPLNARVILR